MKKHKIGVCLFAMALLFAAMADTGIGQPYSNYEAGGVTFTFNNSTNLLNIASSVGFGTNISMYLNPTGGCNVGWYLSPNNSIWVGTDYLVGASSVTDIANFSYKPVSTVIDLDAVAGLPLAAGTVYYVGIFVCYDNFPNGEIMPYEWMYYDNDGCSVDPLKIGVDSQSPIILSSNPDSGMDNASPKDTIIVVFSEWMKTAGFTYAVSPNPGGLNSKWNTKHDTLRIAHNAFSYAAVETVSITHAEDLCGNLLTGRSVITFSTTPNLAPLITMKTQPSSPQTIGRPYLVKAVIKDPAKGGKSITTDSLYYRVDGGSWFVLGAASVKGDTFSFNIPAIDSGLVEYYLQAWDNTGLTTLEPSSGYHTFSVNTFPPTIISSTPDSGAASAAVNAQVMVVFSAPMDTASIVFSVLPNPGGVSRSWNKGRDTLRISHYNFTYATTESVSITHAEDPFGHLLSGRCTITFTTLNDPDPKWDSRFYAPGGLGMNGAVLTIAVSGSNVYVGGNFTTAGGMSANRIAKWDGTSWSALGIGMTNTVRGIAVKGDTVYACGDFTTAGGVSANRIAKWDGTSWSALGSGMNSYVLEIAVKGDTVYAGGDFTTAGGVSANGIAKWDGSAWSALGSGVNHASALAVSGSNLYVGGFFTTAGGVSANNIAKWDGTSWSALGSGVSWAIYSLVLSDGNIYVGGDFSTAGEDSAKRIAKWDGTHWSALGSGTNESVQCLAASGGNVYPGGPFTLAGGISANKIAKWDGSRWSALGSGTNNSVGAIAVSGSNIYVGGSFTVAGGKASSYFGIYNDPEIVPSPVITYSTPDSGASNVALNVPITMAFSKPMDTASFAFDVTPNPGGVTGIWNPTGDTLRISHNPFAYAVAETINISYAADLSGKQLSGRRVITFTTTSNQGPAISIKTQPSDPQTEPGPYLVQAVIADPAKKTGKSITADTLYYSVNSGPWFALGPSGVFGDTFSFQIPAIDSGSIDYCIKAWDNTGLTNMEPEFGYYTFQVDTLKTGVSGRPEPQTFILQLNSASPNPVTGGRTFIKFSLPEQTEVKLEVYNVLGQKVNTLADGRLEKGWHTVDWTGTDQNGQKLSSGVYVYQLKALGKCLTKRVAVIR